MKGRGKDQVGHRRAMEADTESGLQHFVLNGGPIAARPVWFD